MEIKKNIIVPTGNILIADTKDGRLEFLSIGDYGKEKNLKADFMGLTKEINGVEHVEMLPLSEKWVITISTQYGCPMGCKFCDVPKVGDGGNVSYSDLIEQVMQALKLHPEIKHVKRINLHYARMGEPMLNEAVIDSAYYLAGYFEAKGWGFHPVISTMMPGMSSENCINYIHKWLLFKHIVKWDAGLQLSINTTSEMIRQELMPNSWDPRNIAYIVDSALRKVHNKISRKLMGRKITLNFAVTDAEIDAVKLRKWFDPKYYLCKLTPMHITAACEENKLITKDGYVKYYPYKQIEDDLKAEGFDVIVFIPSKEEDESRITCGNAILAQNNME